MRKSSWMVALLLVAGCGDEEFVGGVAEIAGVYDVVRVGDLVFITSANRSELRVLDTAPDLQQNRRHADYVRAPNPLQYLSIPVLERPVALHTDTRYDGGGQEAPGRYVFVRGAGAKELSIVGAARDQLTELQRLRTRGPVTALAAHGAEGDAESILFYAESEAGTSRIRSVRVPAPEALADATLVAQDVTAGGSPLRFVDAQGRAEHVVSLLVMPRLPGDASGWRLAVATRSPHGTGGQALLFQLDESGTQVTGGAPVPLDFGRPVRALMTHGASQAPEGKTQTPAGARIFGILDEAFCDSAGVCGGVLAVDGLEGVLLPEPMGVTRLGQRARDNTGRPMLPIDVGSALVQGLTFVSGLSVRAGDQDAVLPLAGILTASDGNIYYFEAEGVQHIDLQGAPVTAPGSLNVFVSQDQPVYPDPDKRQAELKDLSAALRGELPGLVDLAIRKPTKDEPNPNAVPGTSAIVGLGQLAARARVGDVAQLHALGTGGSRQPCEGASLTVTRVDAQAGTLELSGPLPDPESLPEDKRCTYVSVLVPSLFKDGVLRDEEVRLTYQGALPGLSGQPLPSTGGRGLVLGKEPASRVRIGDFVDLTHAGSSCRPEGSVPLTVARVLNPDTGEVELSDVVPAGCSAFTLRAGTEQPWVIAAAVAGYLGRTAEGTRLGDVALPGRPFFHPRGLRDDAPALDFYFVLPGETSMPRTPGLFVTFGVEDNYLPFRFVAAQGFLLPNGVTYVPEVKISDTDTLPPRIYVAYPSDSVLFQFHPRDAVGGSVVGGVGYR